MLAGDDAAAVTYSYRPSAMGAPRSFALGPDALMWDAGRRSGRIPYRDIRRVRMSFRPVSVQMMRFRTEIWSEEAPKLVLISTSWKNMVDQERHDAPYTRFIVALHQHIAQAGGGARLDQGLNVLLYWLGVVSFAGVSLAMAGMFARGLQARAWTGAAFVGAFLAFFLWWGGNYFRRNRPQHYSADALPKDLMPKGETPGA